ncbi:hypothetical protein ACT453_58990, partial [Bacillus sp. D-CC]
GHQYNHHNLCRTRCRKHPNHSGDQPAGNDAFVKIGMDVMKNTPSEMFANAIISGWLIATMV